MPETDLAVDLRNRAKSMVNEAQPAAAALQQALPSLLILGQQYQAAAKSYAALHTRERNVLALRRIESLAEKRYQLMRDRWTTSHRAMGCH